MKSTVPLAKTQKRVQLFSIPAVTPIARMKLPSAIHPGLVALLLLPATAAVAMGSDAEALFARRVQPLLQEKCLACHGQDEK